MATAKYWIERLQELYHEEIIAITLWSKEDVMDVAEMDGYEEPSQEVIDDILNYIDGHWDAEYGINWDTLHYALEEKDGDGKLVKKSGEVED